MKSQEAFFKEYQISSEAFESTKLGWAQLAEIYDDYKSKHGELLATGRLISDHLSQIVQVHSLKVRVKDPEHLIEKIIRKKAENHEREITLGNYSTEVTDLIGVRALHLFKDDWEPIHKAIMRIWELHEQPKAYIRGGDYEEHFKDNGCTVVHHPAGYRSVHYLVKSQATRQLHIAEIQVRTIFEEGWSEIDHRMRYPYEVDNVILSEHLGVFNRFAGNADEMGTFVKKLKAALEERERVFNEQLAEREREKAEMIKDLKSVTEKLEKETDDKKKLQKIIDKLERKEMPIKASSGALPSPATGAITMSICPICHSLYEINPLSLTGSSGCPKCANLTTSLGLASPLIGSTTGVIRQMKRCPYCFKEYDLSTTFTIGCPHCHKVSV